MKYITEKQGDTQYFIEDDEPNGNKKIRNNVFRFRGFSDKLHPYYKRQIEWIQEVLRSKGIVLYVQIVPTQAQIPGTDNGEVNPGDITIPAEYIASEDEVCYYLIMDEQMGRGWAVLLSEKGGEQTIINQEHRDAIIDWLIEGDFIRSFGIDYTSNQK